MDEIEKNEQNSSIFELPQKVCQVIIDEEKGIITLKLANDKEILEDSEKSR